MNYLQRTRPGLVFVPSRHINNIQKGGIFGDTGKMTMEFGLHNNIYPESAPAVQQMSQRFNTYEYLGRLLGIVKEGSNRIIIQAKNEIDVAGFHEIRRRKIVHFRIGHQIYFPLHRDNSFSPLWLFPSGHGDQPYPYQ